ncbi:SMI1/KNR4 family protein [Metabacillus indicus]|uniref:SMI1/KNR4 family protein n=1 Tax=Metabacillus indicus TaxID=246786 RepID=UPI0004930381|nr:SMI1/KNR4 family protein [Metabacillus indicus]KEZ52455.1 cell wall assembly protein [Metabacillus indicus LMG 22858]
MKIKHNTIVKPLPTDELIKKHEKFWRLKLPESFLRFIKENNGAEIDDGTFEYSNRGYAVERFLCMLDDIEDNPNGIYDIDVVFTQIGERLTDNEDLLGAEVLPIASIFAGDFVCLDYRADKNNPSVCIWSHEESGEFDPVTYKVADSFSEFLNILE